MTRLTAAVDLGGTHVRVALVDDQGKVHRRQRVETPSADETPELLVDLIRRLAPEGGAAPACDEVVIGIPGIVDHDAESVVLAPNLNQDWIPHLTAEWFEAKLGLPVSLANDADLAAVGEAFFGAGRGYRDMVYVTISTGVGAGAVFNGRLLPGRRSGAEIGHTIVDLEAARGGHPATVEQLGAGPAIAKAAAAAGILERDAELADLVRDGHEQATQLWNRAIDAVGAGVASSAWLLAPDVVVIGGGVGANNPDLVLPRIATWLERHGPAVAEPIAVATVQLGDDAALVGAARWFSARGRAVTNG